MLMPKHDTRSDLHTLYIYGLVDLEGKPCVPIFTLKLRPHTYTYKIINITRDTAIFHNEPTAVREGAHIQHMHCLSTPKF